MDGIETTNLQSGLSGKNVIADFVEEVQVKSSGYTAEYGGATGGVINVQSPRAARTRSTAAASSTGRATSRRHGRRSARLRLAEPSGQTLRLAHQFGPG